MSPLQLDLLCAALAAVVAAVVVVGYTLPMHWSRNSWRQDAIRARAELADATEQLAQRGSKLHPVDGAGPALPTRGRRPGWLRIELVIGQHRLIRPPRVDGRPLSELGGRLIELAEREPPTYLIELPNPVPLT